MSDFLGAAVGGAFNLIGDRWNNAFNASQRKMAFEGQRELQLQAQQWAERMRATAYQTTMADMRSAGLNPMLAFGQGASNTPSASAGSSPTAHAAAPSRLGDSIINGFGASARNELMRQQAVAQQASATQAIAASDELYTRADLNREQRTNVQAQTATELENPGLRRAATQQAAAQAGSSAADAARTRLETDYLRRFGPRGQVTEPHVVRGQIPLVERNASSAARARSGLTIDNVRPTLRSLFGR